jgi:hypothetical protein
MRVDIYRRQEYGGNFSYLAVPEGRPIPEEATNVDWQRLTVGIELDESWEQWAQFSIEQPALQMQEKGYAITSLREIDGSSGDVSGGVRPLR